MSPIHVFRSPRFASMHGRILLLAVLITPLLAAPALAAGKVDPGPGRFFVAPDGNDKWSGTLPAPNDDKTDGPVATIMRARDVVRLATRMGLTQDITVYIRGGDYYHEKPIIFEARDSATLSHAIRYKAYPGEHPRLVGGVPVTGWKPYKDRILEAKLPEVGRPEHLFENGRRHAFARHPNTGYLKTEGPAPGHETMGFVYREGDLDPTGWDTAGASVYIWPGHDWFSFTKVLGRIDAETRTVMTQNNAGYAVKPGNRYFVQNILALLDQPGECRIDAAAGKVYCIPRKTPIAEQEMVISTVTRLIHVGGGNLPRTVIRNVHFEGLELSVANGHLVSFTGAEGCSVKQCRLENGGHNGILIERNAEEIAIENCEIRYNGLNGVALQGLTPGSPEVNMRHRIANNRIHHCGELTGHGAGIMIVQSGFNQILNNEIHHMPRYGVSIKGTRYQVLRQQNPDVTWENHYGFLHSHDNRIAFNLIHHVNLDSQDTGAIESWGPGRDNTIEGNIIHTVGNDRLTLQSGIYLDDATDHFTVTGNIIYNVIGAGGDQCIYTKGIANRIENNILIVAPDNRSAIRSFYMAEERCDHHQYLRNIVHFEGAKGAIYAFDNWSDDRVEASDHNVFHKPEGDLSMVGGPADGSYETWRKLFDGKFDAHSITADPLFVNPARRDYRLAPESPALKLGFKPIDPDKVGLNKADIPGRFLEP